MSELRRAAEEAVAADVIKGVMRKLSVLALQGNLAAARILLDRTLGRAANVPASDPLDIQPLRLRRAADCTAALQRVSDAVCAGSLDVGAAKVLTGLIQTQSKLIEVGNWKPGWRSSRRRPTRSNLAASTACVNRVPDLRFE